jgi:hypothetical protein
VRVVGLLLVLPLLLVAAPAAPANAATASVEIIAPAEGSSGYGTNLTVSGRAAGKADRVHVTIEGDVNVYEAAVSKGRWFRHVNELPAGPTTICAEVRGTGGTVLARDCNNVTVTADPSRLAISHPEEGQVLGRSVWVSVHCVTGTTVRLAMDAGERVELLCEHSGVAHTYPGLGEGAHTLTAEMIDQGAVVSTRTRAFTVDLPDPGAVEITSPADGSSGYGDHVTIEGTATSWNNAVYLFVDGAASWNRSVDESGRWEVPIGSLGIGSHDICAAVKDVDYQVEVQDCITYTVAIDPASLTIQDPVEGSTRGPNVSVSGGCASGTTLRITMDSLEPVELFCPGPYTQEFSGLTDGAHTVRVDMLYEGDVIATQQRSFNVDAVAPAAPVVTSPSTKKTITTPRLQLVGTAEPGATIRVWPGDVGFWETTAGDDGAWSLTLDEAFFQQSGIEPGRRTRLVVDVGAEDAYFNHSAFSTYTYTVHLR